MISEQVSRELSESLELNESREIFKGELVASFLEEEEDQTVNRIQSQE